MEVRARARLIRLAAVRTGSARLWDGIQFRRCWNQSSELGIVSNSNVIGMQYHETISIHSGDLAHGR